MRNLPDVLGLNRSILANLAAAAAALSAGASVVATRLAIGETDVVTLATDERPPCGTCALNGNWLITSPARNLRCRQTYR